uniref:AB hydrolase-1 domain-containing protein n=1 Tax=Tetranychus urticae TaxID=32264 RepID=T1KXP5_TETUR
MIDYDTPKIIGHVLDSTGFASLGWIGHSQGTLMLFGLLADQPHYSLIVEPFIPKSFLLAFHCSILRYKISDSCLFVGV